MSLKETLEVLRDAGVSRARLTPEGCLVEVEFSGAQNEAAVSADTERPPREPLGITEAEQEAFDILGGGVRRRGNS